MARAIDAENAIKKLEDIGGHLIYEEDGKSFCITMDALIRFINNLPTIDPVKQFANELINRLNNNASRYVGGICNGRFYPETELFDVDEVYEIIDRVLDGVPEDEGARMDGGAEDGKSD